MKKKLLGITKEVSKEGFRYRGIQTTRLENLTDAVFGFSITLLVISSQVPTTYIELQASMYSFIGFIFCTILLLGLWNNHSNFFLYYGLNDAKTKVLNALFLFVLLFYIYPLKYLFSYIGTAIYAIIKRNMGDTSEALQTALRNLDAADLNVEQWEDLMIRFGLGLFFIYLIIILMHLNALKQAKYLKLNLKEIYITKTFIREYFLLMSIAIVSILVVIIFGGRAAGYSGMVYLLTPIVIPLYKKYRIRQMVDLDQN
ncbi:TMEM175 family protein [Croceitalea rosinachiae]|uniref:TMEM175 family protein n=1 Tax=Croceitalea rosinachiae TaxID=3075596 RepID=A0ABU3A7J0_9FLAO|nr:TMEM175 family protein [Croceitalea sp. F388]MDT0606143.1 TMEM175 family protein [Croceitalea sp. F388]